MDYNNKDTHFINLFCEILHIFTTYFVIGYKYKNT